MTLINYFFIDMSIRTFIRGNKNLDDLTHVTGAIKNERYIKLFHSGTKFNRPYYEDVFVFSIQNCADEFGFASSNDNYADLTKVRYFGNNTIADIYYDKSGQRIEDNVTLHTFDLKIDDVSYIKIQDIQKSERIGFYIFSLVSIAFLTMTFLGLMSIVKQSVRTKNNFNTAANKGIAKSVADITQH